LNYKGLSEIGNRLQGNEPDSSKTLTDRSGRGGRLNAAIGTGALAGGPVLPPPSPASGGLPPLVVSAVPVFLIRR
jgi:hypothetical protein